MCTDSRNEKGSERLGSFSGLFLMSKGPNQLSNSLGGGGGAETRVVIIVFNCVLYYVRAILYNILVPFLIFALDESVTSKNYLGQ